MAQVHRGFWFSGLKSLLWNMTSIVLDPLWQIKVAIEGQLTTISPSSCRKSITALLLLSILSILQFRSPASITGSLLFSQSSASVSSCIMSISDHSGWRYAASTAPAVMLTASMFLASCRSYEGQIRGSTKQDIPQQGLPF